MRLPGRPSLSSPAVALVTALAVAGVPTPSPDRDDPPRAQATAAAKAGQATKARTGTSVGYDTIGVRRGSVTALRNSLAGFGGGSSRTELRAGWLPVPGDLDGDGVDSVSYFYNGTWLLTNSVGGPYARVVFGRGGDRPVLGDWNGDGRDEVGVFRAGLWALKTGGTTRRFVFGRRGDAPLVGDFNGDGRTDVSVRRGDVFYQRSSPTGGPAIRAIRYGAPSDRGLVGDWNHDGRDEVGLFRNGSWYFRMPDGRTQSTTYGRRGDVPFVRRVGSLASGVSHGILRRYDSTTQLAVVRLAASSTPDPVLARNGLGNLERTTSMAARTNAVLAVNGDFAAPSGRPIHPYASDGALAQDHGGGGSGLGLSPGGTTARAGTPSVGVYLTPTGRNARKVQRFNRGTPVGHELAVFTSAGRKVERIPAGGCYAKLVPTGGRFVQSSSGVLRQMKVLGTRCGGAASSVPAGGVLVVGTARGTSGTFVRGLRAGQVVTMNQVIGYAGSVGLVGGSEPLLASGRILSANVDKAGAYARGRQPRTAVGVTRDGRLLLVVVDGRRRGWSAGMTLRQLATMLRDLGAVEAINLDGGGSSTMVLNGLIINRPSDGPERAVSSALVVLRGNDPDQANLRVGPLPLLPTPGPVLGPPPADPGSLQPIIPGLLPGIPGLSPPAVTTVSAPSGARVRTSQDWVRAAKDPGSTGGLAQSEALAGNPLDATLQLALTLLTGG